jgi:anthranilate phosphoribosyltransferase
MMGILTEIKFGAFSIEQQIPEFDKFYGGKFWAPHALSLALPALLSPVQLDHLVFGISAAPIKVSAQVLAERGIKNFTVVSATPDGIRYIDEASLLGKTSWITVKEGKIVKTGSADLGFDHNMSTSIASGKMPGRYEDMICLNAAFMMQCAGAVKTIDEGIIKSRDAIRHGAPRDILNKLIKATNG